MQRRLYIYKAHTAQDILCFAVFLFLLLSHQSTHVPDLDEPKHIGQPMLGLFFHIYQQPINRVYIQIFLMKTDAHTQILNEKSFLTDFRGLRYSWIKICFLYRQASL